MSHTPGPWTLAATDVGCIVSGDTCVVCMGHDYDEGGIICARVSLVGPIGAKDRYVAYEHEKAANARLICAAPDLLAACKRALEEAGELLGATRRGDIRAAIAKAEAQP